MGSRLHPDVQRLLRADPGHEASGPGDGQAVPRVLARGLRHPRPAGGYAVQRRTRHLDGRSGADRPASRLPGGEPLHHCVQRRARRHGAARHRRCNRNGARDHREGHCRAPGEDPERAQRARRRGEVGSPGMRAGHRHPVATSEGRPVRAALPRRRNRPRAAPGLHPRNRRRKRRTTGSATRLFRCRGGLAARQGAGLGNHAGARGPVVRTADSAGRALAGSSRCRRRGADQVEHRAPAGRRVGGRHQRVHTARRAVQELSGAGRRTGRDGNRQRARVRGRASPRGSVGGDRSRQDHVLLQREPRVPNAAHVDARDRSTMHCRRRIRPQRCARTSKWRSETRSACSSW